MSGGLLRSLVLAAACGAAPSALGAATPETGPAAVGQASATPLAATIEQLLRADRLDEAERLVNAALAAAPNNPEARFLSGILALARKDYDHAIRAFRAILIDHPEAVRVRLELARAYFLAEDYANADRQFRFARAGKLPQAVNANIDDYLYAIRQAKDWSYSLSISMAPDTNLNAGTSAREVSLFGLPFELSEDARKRSGVGLAAEASAEFAPRIAKGARLRMGVSGQRREYSGSSFDDMTVAGYVGPRIVTPHWDVSVLANGFIRWFGAKRFLQSSGGRVEATYYPSPTLGLTAGFGVQWLDYAQSDERDGPLFSASLGLFHPLGSTSAISFKSGINRQDTKASAYSNWSGYAAVGYFRELPAGFSAYLEPSVGIARYDAALPAFGVARRDTSFSAQVALLNRHIVLWRFTPRLSYTHTRQNSNIPLYSFTRNRIEIGLTTNF